MADSELYTQQAAMRKGALIITSLASSKLRLFKDGLTLTAFTTKTNMTDVECDFDGYTAGGYTLTAWTGPLVDGGGGAIITSPMTNVAYVPPGSGTPVGNVVGGWWIEDATGNVRLAGQFAPARSVQVLGDGFSMVTQIVEARNAPTVSA